MNDMFKNLLLWVFIAMVLMMVFNNFGPRNTTAQQVDYSDFVRDIKQGQIKEVTIEGRVVRGKRTNEELFTTYNPGDDELINDLLNHNVKIESRPPERQSVLLQIFISWFPMLLLFGLLIFFMRQMQGGGGRGALSFGKSRARMIEEDQVKVTFADVAGVDEAKEEVAELVEFLRDPGKFQNLGGKIPRGVLMVGSPGTGKTLLAKAIAGEA
ncbi:MAG: ATP-dependent metallopeptidase FtsH/Yme1/Tma family protein, partial [Pseudomonadota bacterium]